MLKNGKTLLSLFHIKNIFLFFLFFNLQAKAEIKIIAKNGDTLNKLSKEYGVPLKELMYKNNFNDANLLVEGEVIIIPKIDSNDDAEIIKYKVIKGDTLYKIAKDHNINLKDILNVNNLDSTSILKPNQIILLPKGINYKAKIDQKSIKLANKKVFYHHTSSDEVLSDIAKIHQIAIGDIISLNKLKPQSKIYPNTKLKIRETNTLKWLKYGILMINWSEWRYIDGNYITQAKTKKNKSFYLAISCEKRALNNTLINTDWTSWYFPKNDFEFKLIHDFCDQE
tara:strand:- start:340 stop:1185 length:846 start_codon:yes stop_codon:yes gene_type:complete